MSNYGILVPMNTVTKSQEEFAVIETGGKQYRVSAGDTIKIEKIIGEIAIGDSVTFDKVLLVDNGKDTTIGAPYISGAKVEAIVKDIARHDKVVVVKYLQKSRYHKKNGHKQPYFEVTINSIK
jgi:large subunit ribosomal protein L21